MNLCLALNAQIHRALEHDKGYHIKPEKLLLNLTSNCTPCSVRQSL